MQFSDYRQKKIHNLVTMIRTRNGGNVRAARNINYRSANPNYDPVATELVNEITKDLPQTIKSKISASRLFIRYVSGNLSGYAQVQRLHRNLVSNPTEGVAFLQFIYYLDTPKIGNVNVPENERGVLILNPNQSTVLTFVPKKGHVVFFDPYQTHHEVMFPAGRVTGNVNRDMVIGLLFRPRTATNSQTNNEGAIFAPENYAASVRSRAVIGSESQIPHLRPLRPLTRPVRPKTTLKNRQQALANAKKPYRANAVARRMKAAANRRKAIAAHRRTEARRENRNRAMNARLMRELQNWTNVMRRITQPHSMTRNGNT